MIVGVALDYLPLFVEENGGRAKVGEMTTAEVKQYIVKIQTASAQETYCQRIVRQSVTSPDKAHYVGEASWYVIHHWKSKFIDLVDSLLTHFAFVNAEDKVYLWIDLFCYNQHTKEEKNPTWFQTTLNDVISVTKNTILIMHPWDASGALLRSWCLYEIYTSWKAKCKFEVAMSSTEYSRFIEAIALDPLLFLSLPANQVKSKFSSATKIEDKNAIFAAVEKDFPASSGSGSGSGSSLASGPIFHAEWDAAVGKLLESWIVRHLQHQVIKSQQLALAAEAETETEEEDKEKEKENEEEDREETADGSTSEQGESSSSSKSSKLSKREEEVAEWMRILASVYEAIGRLDSSLPLRQQILATMQKLHGGEDSDCYLAASGALAELYKQMKRFDKARPLLEVALSAMRSKVGQEDPRTLHALQELAALCHSEGILDQAEELFLECFAHRKRLLGEDHKDTLVTMHCLSQLLADTGRSKESITMFNDCITKRKRTLGDDHKDTIHALLSLAHVYNDLGKYDQSLVLFRRVLGDNNLETLRCTSNLSVTLGAQGKFSEALFFLEQNEVKAKFSKMLGKVHPETLELTIRLATTHDDLRDYEKALPLWQECLQAYRDRDRDRDDDDGDDERNQEREARVEMCLESIAQLHLNMGNTTEATGLLNELLHNAQKGGTRENEKVTSLKSRIAQLYADQGDVERAIVLMEECLAERKQRYGEEHTDTLSALSTLAGLILARHGQGDLHKAYSMYQDCLRKRNSVLGKEHVLTKNVKRKVHEIKRLLGGEVEEETKGSWMLF